jgi:hypothetical protein
MEVLEEEKKEKESQEEVPDVVKWLNQLKKHRQSAPEKVIIVPYTEESKSEERIDESEGDLEGSGEDFKDLVDKEAYFISLNQLTYEQLCWLLSERKLSLNKGYENVTEDEIRTQAEEIHVQGCSYDELCWLNAEMMVLHREYGQ